MAVLRKLGAVVLGSLLAAAVLGLAVKLLDRRSSRLAVVEDDRAEPGPPVEPEVATDVRD